MEAIRINLPGMVGLLILLASFVAFGGGSSIIPSRKGLNGFLGFILGATLGIIGMVIVLIIPGRK